MSDHTQADAPEPPARVAPAPGVEDAGLETAESPAVTRTVRDVAASEESPPAAETKQSGPMADEPNRRTEGVRGSTSYSQAEAPLTQPGDSPLDSAGMQSTLADATASRSAEFTEPAEPVPAVRDGDSLAVITEVDLDDAGDVPDADPAPAAESYEPSEPPATVPVRMRSDYPDQPLTTPPPPRLPRQPEAVPEATIASFERMTGVDLGFVPLSRGPIADRASQFNARAFTAEGTVFVPGDRGELDRSDNEALVMHELTHVAQQRLGQRGDRAPTPGAASTDEDQAALVERAFLGDSAAQDALAHEEWDLGSGAGLPPLRSWTPEQGFVSGGFPSAPDLSGAQHAPQGGAGAAPEPAPLPALPPGLAGIGADLADAQSVQYPDLSDLEDLGSEIPVTDAERAMLLTDDDVERIARRVRVPPPSSSRGVDLEDPNLLDGLALNLYDRIRRMLCSELIIDRERSGVLTELR